MPIDLDALQVSAQVTRQVAAHLAEAKYHAEKELQKLLAKREVIEGCLSRNDAAKRHVEVETKAQGFPWQTASRLADQGFAARDATELYCTLKDEYQHQCSKLERMDSNLRGHFMSVLIVKYNLERWDGFTISCIASLALLFVSFAVAHWFIWNLGLAILISLATCIAGGCLVALVVMPAYANLPQVTKLLARKEIEARHARQLKQMTEDAEVLHSVKTVGDNRNKLDTDHQRLCDNIGRVADLVTSLELQLLQAEDEAKKAENLLRRLNDEHRRRQETDDLLATNWRALADLAFEMFLERVFRNLGFQVQTTAKTGDDGADLVVKGHIDKQPVVLVVQVKGEKKNVGKEAVQEAVAAMPVYKCNRCAAIATNGFTKGARKLAEHNRCVLIAGDEIRDLILGKIYPIQYSKPE